MKRLRGFVLLALIVGCAPVRYGAGDVKLKQVRLNYENCRVTGNYKKISLEVPAGFRLQKVEDTEGFCEYRMTYTDSSVLYVSTNIYSGSRLNYENRLQAGITTYSTNRSENDTLRFSGRQADKLFWFESIRGNYAIGYVNLRDTVKFKEAIHSAVLVN